jgi:hypothetical protein
MVWVMSETQAWNLPSRRQPKGSPNAISPIISKVVKSEVQILDFDHSTLSKGHSRVLKLTEPITHIHWSFSCGEWSELFDEEIDITSNDALLL